MIKSRLANRDYRGRRTNQGVSIGSDVTLVMPTRHRPKFVRAYITFLATSNFGGHLVIVDGSDHSSEPDLRACFENLYPAFRLTVLDIPKESGDSAWVNINECIHHASPCIDTNYACLCFDDDFILPHFLERATQILIADPKIGFVVGGQLALEFKTRDRAVPWPMRAHFARNIRRIDASQAVSRVADFFAAPYQLAYAVVRTPTFARYVPVDHRQYFLASLSSDFSWYCAVLASGIGVALPECEVIRLFHDSNTKTYGQSAAEVFQALLDGRVAADTDRLAKRIESLSREIGNQSDADRNINRLVPDTALSIVVTLLAGFCSLKARGQPLSWLASTAFRVTSKASSLRAGMDNYKSIRLLDETLRVHGL